MEGAVIHRCSVKIVKVTKMATSGEAGVDWIAVQKSLVSASQAGFRSGDVSLLIDAILER